MQHGMDSEWTPRKVCVIGAGTMGGGIAAHLANLKFDVSLLDLSLDEARKGLDRARQARPNHFYVPDAANKIRTGSIQENLDWAVDADWVCEAIVEKPEAKKSLFARLDEVLPPSTMVSTNTSGLEIGALAEGRTESFRRRFLGTHFFNPPRYLKLLELIPTGDTDPVVVRQMTAFLEDRVARRVVVAKDTPGFIANRFGMWAMFHAVHVAEKLQFSVETVDAITGPFLGRPRSASFRLNDIVGLDIMDDIAKNLRERCAPSEFSGSLVPPSSMAFLLEKGWIGEKAGRGYYRRQGKDVMVFDLTTRAYRDRLEPDLPSLKTLAKTPLKARLRQAIDLRDEVGEYLREYLFPTLRYAISIQEEVSHSICDFDNVMKWGFGWEMGPFEIVDAIGHDRFGQTAPFYQGSHYRDLSGQTFAVAVERKFATLADFPVIEEKEGLKVRDLGDGVAAVGIATKMGILNPTLVWDFLELVESGRYGRLVVAGEDRCFSAGFDLRWFLEKIEDNDLEAIDQALVNLQTLSQRLSAVPSVAAVHGYCLGGGMEIAMGCATIAVAAESQVGLPEAKVGLLPAGTGTARVRMLAQDGGARSIAEAAHRLTLGTVSANADDGARLGFLRPTDRTVYLADRLIDTARSLALEATPRPLPAWKVVDGPVAGMIDRLQNEERQKGDFSDHDEFIGDRIKTIVAKSSSVEDALAREREAFLELCTKALSIARMRHMIETGKPLRN
mgnify:CR=1 FL=1